MTNRRVFETRLNVLLSELLNEVGVVSRAEQFSINGQRRDIVVYHQGLHIVLEGSYSMPDAQNDAGRRIEQLACDVAFAVWYPPTKFPQNLTDREVKERLKESEFRVRIVASEDMRGTLFEFLHKKRIVARPVAEWQRCDLSSLGDLIREVGQFMITEQHMSETEEKVGEFIDDFVERLSSFSQSNAIARNIYDVLYRLYGFSIGNPIEIKEAIFAQAALAVLLSSVYYQTIGYVHKLKSLRTRTATEGGPQCAVENATRDILGVDYEPIFSVTQKMLPLFPPMPQTFHRLVNLASDVAAKKTLLRRDIAGRIYHKIIGSWSLQKGLATFYTQIPAAYLLLYLARPELSKICDFACGSGTLLTAAYSAMNSRYRFSLLTKGIDKGPEKIEEEFHRQFIESCYGFDVLTYATQITALNLALHSPETRLNHMSIQSIPLGYREDSTFASLGSLELIREPKLDVMTDRISRVGVETTGEESLKKVVSELGHPSLVVMNPPFTRPTGRGGRQGGGFFGFLSDENTRTRVRKEYNEVKDEVKRKLEVTGMALLDNPATKELKSLLGHKDFQAYKNIGLAGEGLLFLYLAHKLVRRGGKICFVLPKSLLTGVSWFLARCLLASKYQIEYCVVSYDSKKGYNFSESTSLSECLIVARKGEVQKEKETRFVILLEKPGTSVEAIGLSNTISEEPGDYVQSGNAKAFVLTVHRKAILEHIDNWGRFVFLPNLTLLREIEGLLGGTIKVGDVEGKMPVTRLNNLILSIGVDRHQFNSSFQIMDDHIPGSLAVLHGGGEKHMKGLEISLNTYALPRDDRGRSLFERKAARLLLPDRFRFNTAHTVSMVSREQTLSNLFYAVRLKMNVRVSSRPFACTLTQPGGS